MFGIGEAKVELRGNERGLLLMDVDGPLNPYLAKPWRRPDGYCSFRLTNDDRFVTGPDFRRHKGIRVWLNPDHGSTILDLAKRARLRPCWATTWQDRANRHIAPAIGLPDLPVIRFPEADLLDGWWTDAGGWKWNGVAEWGRNIPLAWWDDEHDVSRWARPKWARAKDAFLASRGDTPTLLCHVDPATGLLDQHVDAVARWAATLPAPP